MEKIFTSSMKFLDQSGRERIFNGLNFVHKETCSNHTNPAIALPDWNDTHFSWCAEQGINLIRFGLNWNLIEPEMGVYSETYLGWIQTILNLCAKYNISVFLDMHQDLYSCLYGNGAPKWATLSDNCPHIEGDLWSDAYLYSTAVKRSFENFWANKPLSNGVGVQDHFINMWLHIINRFKDHPALLGYDFFNEPFPGESSLDIFSALLRAYANLTEKDLSLDELANAFSEPNTKRHFLLELDDKTLYSQMVQAAEPLVKNFDTLHLQPFYEKITRATRQVTNKGIILMENCYFSNSGIPCNLSPIQDINGNREKLQAYAPHGYDLVVDTPDTAYLSYDRLDVIFDTHRKVQEKLAVPVIIGEWGAHYMHKEGLEYIEHLLDIFDAYKWSHTYWCYQSSIKNAPAMALLNRPYPQAVCGEILHYGYVRKDNCFTLSWNEESNSGLESIIYLHTPPSRILFEGLFELHPISSSSKGCLLKIPNESVGKRTLQVFF